MSELPKIKIALDAVGRGTISINGNAINGVVALSVEVNPAEAFNRVTMTIVGPVEAELEVESESIAVQRLAGPAAVADTPA